jgi:hypothetical protein
MMADDSTLLSGVSELDTPQTQSQTLTEQRLKFWYQQADPQTRDRFMQWIKQQPSCPLTLRAFIFLRHSLAASGASSNL